MTKKQKAEMAELGVERYRQGYGNAIGATTTNLNDIADHLDDFDPHGAKVIRWLAELISTYQSDE